MSQLRLDEEPEVERGVHAAWRQNENLKLPHAALIGKGASSSGKRAASCAARTQNSFGMVSTKSGNRCQLFPIVKGIFEGIHVTADRCSIIQIEGATNSRKNPSASPCRTRQHQGQGDG